MQSRPFVLALKAKQIVPILVKLTCNKPRKICHKERHPKHYCEWDTQKKSGKI